MRSFNHRQHGHLRGMQAIRNTVLALGFGIMVLGGAGFGARLAYQTANADNQVTVQDEVTLNKNQHTDRPDQGHRSR